MWSADRHLSGSVHTLPLSHICCFVLFFVLRSHYLTSLLLLSPVCSPCTAVDVQVLLLLLLLLIFCFSCCHGSFWCLLASCMVSCD